jgi:hypothetical protein
VSTFVLVHGAWHDGSAWESVIKHLEAQRHQAFAPTIAGHGKGVNENVNHAECTQSIVDYIVDKDLTNIATVQKIMPCLKVSGAGIQKCLIAWGYFGLYKCRVVMRFCFLTLLV